MTVQTAVAIAGGFTPRGQRSSAEVTRQIDGLRRVLLHLPRQLVGGDPGGEVGVVAP